MPWKRGYYFRSRREGDRIISEYHGKGLLAEIQALEDQLEQERKQAERAEIQTLEAADREAGAIFDQVGELVEAALLAAGCYQHHGIWRRRNAREPNTD